MSKNVYFDVLDNIADRYNNTYHRTIKMKPIDVKSDFYAEYSFDPNDKKPKYKVGYDVRISKYKNSFAKGYVANWSEEVFSSAKEKIQFHGHKLLLTLMVKKIVGTFYGKELQKANQKNLE